MVTTTYNNNNNDPAGLLDLYHRVHAIHEETSLEDRMGMLVEALILQTRAKAARIASEAGVELSASIILLSACEVTAEMEQRRTAEGSSS